MLSHNEADYRIAGNFRRRKLCEFRVFFWLIVKVFPRKLGAWHPWSSKSEQSVKVFSTKIIFFTNSRKFSHSKVFRYAVYLQ